MTSNLTCGAAHLGNFHQVSSRSICPFLTYNAVTADALCHAVTLAFDPLTLNGCNVSDVTSPNALPNLSEIEQSASELLRFQYVQFGRRIRHLGFDRKSIITIPLPLGSSVSIIDRQTMFSEGSVSEAATWNALSSMVDRGEKSHKHKAASRLRAKTAHKFSRAPIKDVSHQLHWQ